ncbi:MAG: thiamine pyrophosphate-dependent enzyme [Chloroflexota bacterium]|nr:thiamine pyrophosphate-dependent enzyme [Chloroflexota bacterium]
MTFLPDGIAASGIDGADLVYERPAALSDVPTHYCPGCTHGLIHRLIAEVIDELQIRERTLCVAPVGCAVFAYTYFNVDGCEAAHGRAPAMATGLKRIQPDKIVFTYQGDGDLAAIGTNEIIHAANRGEKLTVIFVNNANYGMTGGQMAPTTLAGMVTTSSPYGRDVSSVGQPMRVAELIAALPGTAYVVRRSVHNVANIRKTKAAIKTAFQVQMEGLGLSLVEVLSSCPTNWRLKPADALRWIEDEMVPVFPIGDYRVADQVVPLTRRRSSRRNGK